MSKKNLFCTLFILIFLIPPKQDSNAKTWLPGSKISADSIMIAIERGEDVEIDRCEIIGPLVKSCRPFNRDTIKSLIRISRSVFSDSIFFKYCHFLESVYFESDSFCQDVEFIRVTFGRAVIFSGARFDTNGNFWGATFNEYTNFEAAHFYADAYLGEVTFKGKTTFSGAIFEGKAGFWLATFDTTAYFMFATFGGDAPFDSVTFRADVYFGEATFGREVDLNPIEFKNIDISWKQLEGHLVYHRRANYKLMKYFEDQRQLEDADGIYLFLKDQERMRKKMRKKWYVRYAEYWFIQLTCGYGVKPLNTLYSSIFIIFLWTLLYTKSNAIKEIEKELGHRRKRRKYRIVHKGFWMRFYDALYFSIHTFIIGVVSDWHPTDEYLIRKGKIKLFKFRTLSMMEGALGWILLVLFVVTLTRKFIR